MLSPLVSGFLAVLASLAGLATPAGAVIGAVDDVPGATLLLPYFEVDLDREAGITTLFPVNNASDTSACDPGRGGEPPDRLHPADLAPAAASRDRALTGRGATRLDHGDRFPLVFDAVQPS